MDGVRTCRRRQLRSAAMAPRPALLAVIGSLAVSLAACASSHEPAGEHPSPCPRGSPYRPRSSWDRRLRRLPAFRWPDIFFGQPTSVSARHLGPVITHVRCSLTAEEDPSRTPPQIIDGTASFLGVGTPVYAVRGYSPACRLAAYLNGQLQPYLAQAEHGTTAPTTLPCALSSTLPTSSAS
jgi:hypothetical protein